MPSKYLTLMSKIGLKISLQWQNIIFFTFPNMSRWVLVKKVILGFQGSDLAVPPPLTPSESIQILVCNGVGLMRSIVGNNQNFKFHSRFLTVNLTANYYRNWDHWINRTKICMCWLGIVFLTIFKTRIYEDTFEWTYVLIDSNAIQLSIFLPFSTDW